MSASAGRSVRLQLDERDYCYGQGPLHLKVERIDRANPIRYDGENWYRVEGIQIGWNDAEIGRREVLVRGRRLPPS